MTDDSSVRRGVDLVGIALGLAATASWASVIIATRFGLTSAGLSAWDLTAIRMGTAGLLLTPLMARYGVREMGGLGWRRAIILTVLLGPPFALITIGGYVFAPATQGALVAPPATTLFTMLVGVVVLGERFGGWRLTGVVFVLTALALVTGSSFVFDGLSWVGDLMFVGSGLSYAMATVLMRRWRIDPVRATSVVSALGMATMLPPYLAIIGWGPLLANPAAFVTQALVQGVLTTVVANIAYNAAARRVGVAPSAVFPALVPGTALALSLPILGEVPTLWQILGLLLMTAGLFLAVGVVRPTWPMRRAPANDTPAPREGARR